MNQKVFSHIYNAILWTCKYVERNVWKVCSSSLHNFFYDLWNFLLVYFLSCVLQLPSWFLLVWCVGVVHVWGSIFMLKNSKIRLIDVFLVRNVSLDTPAIVPRTIDWVALVEVKNVARKSWRRVFDLYSD